MTTAVVNTHWFAGLDLGQANDFTALAIAERSAVGTPTYAVRVLRRWALGTGYPVIVRDVVALLQKLPLARNTTLAVDATGVGPPVVDMLREQAPYWLPVYGVTITAGNVVGHDGWTLTVPKRDLVSTVRVLLQARPSRLKAAPTLPDVKLLAKELEGFQVKISTAGRDTYGAWREGTHDDLVLAVALAVWGGENLGNRPIAPVLEVDWRLGTRDRDETSRQWLHKRLVVQRQAVLKQYGGVVDDALAEAEALLSKVNAPAPVSVPVSSKSSVPVGPKPLAPVVAPVPALPKSVVVAPIPAPRLTRKTRGG